MHSSNEHPLVVLETQLYSIKLTVWSGFHESGIIVHFFCCENGSPTTINSDHYRTMISKYFSDQFEAMKLNNICFQQDGVTYCRTEYATIELVKTNFDQPREWPPHACDLNPLHFFIRVFFSTLSDWIESDWTRKNQLTFFDIYQYLFSAFKAFLAIFR